MAGKKKSSKKVQRRKIEKQPQQNRWVDFLRLDESYTSLILGIIVVIIASVLLVAFVKGRHAQRLQQATSSISTGPTSYLHNLPLTVSPTQSELIATSITSSPTATAVPTATITPTPTKAKITSSPSPTKVLTPTATITPTPTKIVPTIQPHQVTPANTQVKGGGTYTVKSGDDLWHIAEKVYGSGYNWVDIARANHLANPGDIYSGNVLQLPKVAPKVLSQPQTTTPTPVVNNNVIQAGPPITTSTYVVQKGDSLWTISERAYQGNGYEWVNIAKLNHLANPGDIYSGNVLKLPR